MARQQKPRDATQFTRESAERIARVVRAAEQSVPAASPLSFEKFAAGGVRKSKSVRVATFTGSWAIGSTKTVSFKVAPTGTAIVTNLSWPLASTSYVNEDCLVAKEGTNWWLVVPVLQPATAMFVTQTQAGTHLVGISIAANINTNNCSISVSQTPTTAQITLIAATATVSFLRLRAP